MVQLEPLSAEVLSYFCRHPDTTISRDELIDAVWQSRVVTDNAVNRVIAKLRKALGDDKNTPQFITTYPRKGYRFIAPVEAFSEGQRKLSALQVPVAAWVALAVVVVVASVVVFMFARHDSQPGSPAISGVEFLTRGGDQEFQPAVSPDGRYLAYSTFNDQRLQLFLKDLQTQDVVQIGMDQGYSGPASWSGSGRYIAYLYTDEDNCQLHRLTMDGLTITEREVVHHCPNNSYGRVIFSHDDDVLIFAEASEAGPPYSIFELDLTTSITRRLPQPELVLAGNIEFDLHPHRNELLITSPDEQLWLGFYSLDLDTDELKLLFRLNEYVCCGIWSTDGSRIVLIGEHPAYELVSYGIDGKNRQVIYRAPHRISSPKRFGKLNDYTYVGGIYNRDIVAFSPAGDANETIVDSSVDDRLAAVSPEGVELAYLSDRSGKDEVWVHDLSTGSDRKLTSLDGGHHYFDLQWSPDGRYLVAMTINGLHLISAADGSVEELNLSQTEMRGVSWKANTTIAYSVKVPGGWRVQYYDISSGQVTEESEPWYYIRYALNPENTLWFSEAGEVYFGPDKQPLILSISNPVLQRRFNPTKHGDTVYYFQRESGRSWQLRKAQAVGEGTQPLEPQILFTSENPDGISIFGNTMYFPQVVSHSADIYRTINR